MKPKDDINSKLGKVVKKAKDAFDGKKTTEQKSTKRIISKMTL